MGRAIRDGRRRTGARGQGLVEFALGITIFLTIFIGLIDLARAAFLYNGLSEAAREVARVTSVHPGGLSLGSSPEVTSRVNAERALMPGFTVISFSCVDLSGAVVTDPCNPGYWVRISVRSSFFPVLPLLSVFGPIQFTTTSSAKIQ
jgi:hypothetical protein